MIRYKDLLYKYQTDLRGLKKPDELIKTFTKTAKWYNCRLRKLLPKDPFARILDLPCGCGNFLYFLKKAGYKNILGVDFDYRQIELATSIGLNAVVEEGLLFLENKNDKYDLISSIDFLEHLEKDELLNFLQLCFKALKKDGQFILRAPCSDGLFGARDRYNDLTHETGFTSGAIDRALGVVGFKDIVILDERPQPYKLVNLVRWVLFVAFTGLANLVLLAIGISPPRVWTTSMWVSARK
jgi:SAM-dependent methyltransferase